MFRFRPVGTRFKSQATTTSAWNLRRGLLLGRKVASVKVSKNEDHFVVEDGGPVARVTFAWIRDHCRSTNMYNARAHQRLYDIRTMEPDGLVPIRYDVAPNGTFSVKWKDGATSSVPLDVLQRCNGKRKIRAHSSTIEPETWDASTVPREEKFAFKFTEFINNQEVLRDAYGSIAQHGLVMIKDVPHSSEDLGLLAVVNRLAKPFNIGPNYEFGDGFWKLTSTDIDTLSDAAHTNAALDLHTDGTYLKSAPGLIVFHCLRAADNGGESILADGFKIAENFRKKFPDSFQFLLRTPVEAEYLHTISEPKEHFYNVDCLIKPYSDNPEGTLEQIRFNNSDRAPLHMNLQDQREFYQHYPKFVREVMAESYSHQLKLTPGNVLAIDNWRMLHGRTSYSGERILTGYYVSRDDVLSKFASLGL